MAIPADPNDGSLLSSVFLSSDNAAYKGARDLWSMSGLPHAEYGDFFSGANADRVYMTSHGLCLSFVYRRSNVFNYLSSGVIAPVFEGRHLVDDRILQPLLQVDLGNNCCFEIVPGVQSVGADKKTVRSLARALKNEQIDFYAPEAEYVGQMRSPDTQEPVYLIVNRRSVKPASKQALVRGAGDSGVQDLVFGALREQFAQAWSEDSGAAFEKAMGECARITALPADDSRKILCDHWNSDGPKTHRRTQIAQAAQSYARTLAAV